MSNLMVRKVPVTLKRMVKKMRIELTVQAGCSKTSGNG